MEPLIAALEAGRAAPQTLRTLGVGGGRVPTSLCRRSLAVLPGRECKVLYGSTEAEPISSVSFEEVVAAEGEGVLVGHVAQQAEVAIVQLPNEPVVLDDRGLAPYLTEHGELLVRGPHVNRNYVDNEEADRANKLATKSGSVWHRTGDVGRRDAQGRLWLTGRVADLVTVDGRVVHPFPVEQAAEEVVGLRRAALIDSGKPQLVVEPQHGTNKSALEAAVKHFLAQRDLAGLPIVLLEQIPMDRRHHSKIDRPALRATLSAKR
jgi:acyl-CoA synthetase (AMP-forming)/AMP-acid ligase II